jgi:hypothetical protein
MKHRTDPLREGSLKKIWQLWFGRWVADGAKPQRQELYQWLETLWAIKEREVTRYRAREAFRMPGILYVAASVKIQGIGARDVKKGAEIWVRHDTRTPNSIDVQWIEGNHERQFNLSSTEWNQIAPLLEVKERKKKDVAL